MTSSNKATPDWEQIELDYRAGIKTLRQIAEEHGISHGLINKRAKKEGWARDLSSKIRRQAESLVASEAVREQNRPGIATERHVIEVNAQMQAHVIREHRAVIGRSRRIAESLLVELEFQTDNLDVFEKLGELMFNPDENGKDKLNEAYFKAMSTGGRASTLQQLTSSLKTLVTMERQAFGLREDAGDTGMGYEDALRQMLEGGAAR